MHQVNTNLTNKYDIHFNFFLTKPVTEIVYNHTNATTTISFKDSIIFADNNEYLKRYYFLKNAQDKDQIYDRINLLAQFYGNAVLLRYQYPLMILTKTKSIFQKRLKRMKKMLVEQGSSDQSKSNMQEKAVSINSSQFLRSVSSGELQRKSIDQGHNLQLDFSLWKEASYQIYDIFQQNQSQDSSKINHSTFNLINLAKNLTQELILESEQKQDQLKHLMVDFDDFDKEEIIRKYHKIMEKENGRQSSKQSTIRKQDSIIRSANGKNPMKIRELMEKKPMASSITITALEDHIPLQPNSPSALQNLKKKSMISPNRISTQPQQPHPKNLMKRSSYYQYETEHHNFGMNNEVIAEDQMEDSPKNNHRRIKKFPSMDQQDFNQYNKRADNSAHKRLIPVQPRTSRQGPNIQQNYAYNTPIMKYSSIEQGINRQKPYQFYKNQQRYSNLPFRKEYNNNNLYDANGLTNRLSPMNQPNRMTSINININNLQQKKEAHRVNVKFNSKYGQDFAQQQRNYRAEKKRKIREKAAALLNRVKSQEYMRTHADLINKDYQYQDDAGQMEYFQRYY